MEVIRKRGVKGYRIIYHNKKVFYAIIAIIIILIGIAVYLILNNDKTNNPGIANPASVYCIEHDGTLEIKDSPEGQYGLCLFEDGSSCEEWKYFRGECSKGESLNECNTDSDCVPASCCHAKACVSASNAPVCKGMMCTMNCEPGTLDCGGKCACVNNKCSAQLI